MKDLISIVIPAFNAESTLTETINSVINQTFQKFEVIVVNDGSTDGTMDLLDKLASTDSRIKIINIKNGGVSQARNTGMQAADGEWITFLDADDILESTFLENLKKEQAESSADLVISSIKLYHDETTFLKKQNFSKDRLLTEEAEIRELAQATISGRFLNESRFDMGILGYCPGKLFASKIAKAHQFNTDIILREDALFNLEFILDCKKIYLTNTSLYRYIVGRSTATVKYNPRMNDSIRIFLDSTRKVFVKHHFKAETYFECGLYTYMLWLKSSILSQKNQRVNQYISEIYKSTQDILWTTVFTNVDPSEFGINYKLLILLFNHRMCLSILLLGLLNNKLIQQKRVRFK